MVKTGRNANMTLPEHVLREVIGVKSDDILESDIVTDQSAVFAIEIDACGISIVVQSILCLTPISSRNAQVSRTLQRSASLAG